MPSRNTIKPSDISERMRSKVTPRRVSNWLTGERSPNVEQLAELLSVLPDVDARTLITELAARYRSKR